MNKSMQLIQRLEAALREEAVLFLQRLDDVPVASSEETLLHTYIEPYQHHSTKGIGQFMEDQPEIFKGNYTKLCSAIHLGIQQQAHPITTGVDCLCILEFNLWNEKKITARDVTFRYYFKSQAKKLSPSPVALNQAWAWERVLSSVSLSKNVLPRKRDGRKSIHLFEENRDRLDDVAAKSTENPLHMAARIGNFELAREIILRKPGFARDLNQDGDSPLHLAAASRFVEIVREMLKVDPDMFLLRDKDGRTALHCAAINGRVEVMNELLYVCPESVLEATTARGEAALHLAASYEQTEAFRLLVESTNRINIKELVNWKDLEGNPVLNHATSTKHLQALEVLVDGKMLTAGEVQVNALNAGGFPALIQQSPALVSPHKFQEAKKKDSPHKFQEAKKDSPLMRNAMLIVAVMIASVTYQAINSGIWKEIYTNQSYQNSIFQPWEQNFNSKPIVFPLPMPIRLFALFNSAGFFASIALMVVLISGFPFRPLLLIAAFSLLISYMFLIAAMFFLEG